MLAERRVRRLRIRSQEPVAVPRITALVEDAFRTASLPGIPPSGVVCIRQLDLGRLSLAAHSRFISRRLDTVIRNVSFVHITSESSEQPAALAVWFANAIEPYRCLAVRLAQGNTPQAWYWTAAVPTWSPQQSPAANVLQWISPLLQQSTGMTGLVYALEPLVQQGTLFTLLDQLTEQSVRDAWRDIVWPTLPRMILTTEQNAISEETALRPVIDARVTRPWKLLLRQSLQQWRSDDARLKFVFAITAHQTGLALTPEQGRILLELVIETDVAKLKTVNRPAALKESESSIIEFTVSKTTHDSRTALSAAGDDSMDATSSDIYNTAQVREEVADDTLGTDIEVLQTPDDQPQLDNPPRSPPWTQHGMLSGQFAGEYTEHAGFLFLISVMQHLGMTSLLENIEGDRNAALQLPWLVLWRLANWLQVPAADPVLQFLEIPSIQKQDPPVFVAPSSWRMVTGAPASASRPISICRVHQQPGKRLIYDGASRLVLGVWQPGRTDAIRAWLAQSTYIVHAQTPVTWNFDDFVNNYVKAMCRYVHRHARLSLRQVVRRPAYIATTRTHVDWHAPLSQLDHRIRAAGMDIDPGWIPWLNRVFYFHYIESET